MYCASLPSLGGKMISHSFAPRSCSFHISLLPSFWDDTSTFCACLVVLWKPGPPCRCLKKAMAIGGAQLVRLRTLDKMWSTQAQLSNRARCREGQGDVWYEQSPWVEDPFTSTHLPTHPPPWCVKGCRSHRCRTGTRGSHRGCAVRERRLLCDSAR